MVTSQHVIAEARRWIGTRFAHQGRRKATHFDPGGVDCLGLLIGIAQALALVDRHGVPLAMCDARGYSRQPDGAALHAALERHLLPVACHAIPPMVTVGLFMFDGQPQHLAILVCEACEDTPHMIHAYALARRVVEHRMDFDWKQRLIARFMLPLVH
jgi:hypothetical protein